MRQAQVYHQATSVSARHMYTGQHQQPLQAFSSIRHYVQQQPHPLVPPALVLPPLGSGGRVVGTQQATGMSSPVSATSTLPTCYSPGSSMASDATVVEYPTSGVSSGGGKNSKVERKSPSLSCTSSQSKTASPAPPATETADLGKRRRGGGRGGRSKYTAEEKEMRRKISHSAIEKRRRERTNNVLRDLQDMVPWLSKSSKVQKLEILEAAAQHIKELRAASGAPLFVRSSASPASSRPIDDDSEDDDDDEVSSSSPSAMKVNFLLS